MRAICLTFLLLCSLCTSLPVNIDSVNYIAAPSNDKTRTYSFHVICWQCKLVVGALQQLMIAQKSKDKIGDIVDNLCYKFHIEDNKVCDGIVAMFKEEVVVVAGKLLLNPSNVCALIVGTECANFTNPWANWTVDIPDVPKPPPISHRNHAPGAPKLRVLQISDIHLDLQYIVGSNINCGEPLCCRSNDGKTEGSGAGQWGDYRQCDTPLWTLTDLFKHLSTNDKFDYILWTGDLPGHDDWNQTRQAQLHHVQILTQLLLKYFPSTPILPAVGNHESTPVNSFPPLSSIKGPDSISWLYDGLAESWSHWLDKEAVESIRKWLLLDPKDPSDQLKWLVEQLQEAEEKHEKVHIIGHIPPGNNDCLKVWSWNYYRIINRFESTVVAQFFGHTHFDSWQIFYDVTEAPWRPVSVAYVGPSVTPYFDLNPGYRVYTIDGPHPDTTWGILDHETYILNLTEANLSNKTVWRKEYSAKSAYGLESLWPQDWDALLRNMKSNSTLFNQYYRYYYKEHPPSDTCDKVCRYKHLCEILSGRSHDSDTFCRDLDTTQDDMDTWITANTRC